MLNQLQYHDMNVFFFKYMLCNLITSTPKANAVEPRYSAPYCEIVKKKVCYIKVFTIFRFIIISRKKKNVLTVLSIIIYKQINVSYNINTLNILKVIKCFYIIYFNIISVIFFFLTQHFKNLFENKYIYINRLLLTEVYLNVQSRIKKSCV